MSDQLEPQPKAPQAQPITAPIAGDEPAIAPAADASPGEPSGALKFTTRPAASSQPRELARWEREVLTAPAPRSPCPQ